MLPTLATAYYNGHQIIVEWSNWSGKLEIQYDGKVVSEGRKQILSGTHSFQVLDDGEVVHFELDLGGWSDKKVKLIRNGLVIFSNEKGFRPPPEVIGERKKAEPIVKETIVKEIVLVVCPNCSHRNDSSRRTCEKCGVSI
ncbi:hypothetical protein ES703_83678 [subsurface metagenome]